MSQVSSIISFNQTRAFHLLRQMTAVFNRSCSLTAQCLKPEESFRSSGQKGRHTNLHAFPDIMQNFGAGGRPSSFSLPGFHSDYFLEKSQLPDCLCLKSTRAFIPDWYTSALDPKSSTAFNRICPRQLKYTEAKEFLRYFGQRSSHVPPSLP